MAHAVSTAVPDAAARAAILALADLVEREDGAPPLSDEARVRLASPDVVHLTASDGVQVLGYAQRGEDGCEVVAVADWLDVLLDTAVPPDATVWSHGSRSRLIPALRSRGLVRIRELLQLRRPLGDHPLPSPPELPADVRVRAFEPGRDDAAWLTLNAAAFAAHPEQGRWTVADLRARQAEPWFDPAGFLLAERDAELVGFHWTKVHPDGGGEVYVLGVSPAAQGLGLGAALLVQGLAHLARRGCPYVLLYVDGDNGSAVRLYERAGFTKYDVDVQWRAV